MGDGSRRSRSYRPGDPPSRHPGSGYGKPDYLSGQKRIENVQEVRASSGHRLSRHELIIRAEKHNADLRKAKESSESRIMDYMIPGVQLIGRSTVDAFISTPLKGSLHGYAANLLINMTKNALREYTVELAIKTAKNALREVTAPFSYKAARISLDNRLEDDRQYAHSTLEAHIKSGREIVINPDAFRELIDERCALKGEVARWKFKRKRDSDPRKLERQLKELENRRRSHHYKLEELLKKCRLSGREPVINADFAREFLHDTCDTQRDVAHMELEKCFYSGTR